MATWADTGQAFQAQGAAEAGERALLRPVLPEQNGQAEKHQGGNSEEGGSLQIMQDLIG